MIKNRSKGFTLIELLVVIAIIGILSAVVLASLNTARSKGNDAAIQANLDTVRTQAEIFYGSGNTYGATFASGTCPTTTGTMFYDDVNIRNAIKAAEVANGTTNNVTCNSQGTTYAVLSPLSSGNWCVDSTGYSGKASAITSNACVPS
jgi:prepilin-type N-terminal cleavage/methylation domain-containing protein